MSPILTDGQRKRIAKWMTALIFDVVFAWLMPLFLGIALLIFLAAAYLAFLIYYGSQM